VAFDWKKADTVMKRRIVVASAVITLVALAVAGFVTPGYVRYEHQTMQLGIFGIQEIRTDRFTGRKQVYGGGRWQDIDIDGNKITIHPGTQLEIH